MTEQNPHYRCLFLIPEYQAQTAFVSHTLLMWHNPKLMWGDRNPPIDFSTFQSRDEAGEVISYQTTFPLFNKEDLKSHFSQLLAEIKDKQAVLYSPFLLRPTLYSLKS